MRPLADSKQAAAREEPPTEAALLVIIALIVFVETFHNSLSAALFSFDAIDP
jgi:hypothetical protein